MSQKDCDILNEEIIYFKRDLKKRKKNKKKSNKKNKGG
jgi:hypothetical protein